MTLISRCITYTQSRLFLLRAFPDSTMNKILNSDAWVLARSTNLMAGDGTEIENLSQQPLQTPQCRY